MSVDFLLELLSEEIPARMQAKARNDLARLFAEQLAAAGLSHEGITIYSTPRRLALIAKGLPRATEAQSEELRGPRTSAPPQALEGFLRKTGLSRDQLEDRDGTWFAVIDRPGRATSDVLADAVAAIVRDFPWPKSMRWGQASGSTASLRWVRPLHSIVALLGEEIVPVQIDGIECGATTLGHRFHHPGPITIGGAHDYVEKLRACHVVVDQEEREATIRDGAAEAAKRAGFALVEDEGLVVENAGLTELPRPLLGSFDPAFLDVPEEVIQLTARINQKYFVMRDGEQRSHAGGMASSGAGRLASHFVCVANIDANDGGEAIVAGNQRVLAARLSDARFFWEQDLKVPLAEQREKLSQIVFHEKLGTVADKVERVAKLARWLVEEKVVTPAKAGVSGRSEMPASAGMTVEELADQAERAARLAKADLVTGMVGEFPELQGVIGGYLARAQGEPDAVADALRDHYKPVGQGDDVPTAPVTVAVSLADKLDSVLAFFAVDERPTGSKDPFALRRAVLGAISLITHNELRFPMAGLIASNLAILRLWALGNIDASEIPIVRDYGDRNFSFGQSRNRQIISYGGKIIAEWDKKPSPTFDRFAFIDSLTLIDSGVWGFIADRLKVQQRDAGVRHDLIDAVFALGGEDDLVRLLARVNALQGFIEKPEGANLLAGYKRAANILKKEEWDRPTLAPSLPGRGDMEPAEQALIDALNNAGPHAAEAVEQEDFTGAMAALSTLRGPIDAFFDKVTVNVEDAAVRARRLNLLARFRDAVHAVADFSKIEG